MNHDDRPIFLVGFMASGKSAVGRALARALGWRLLDTDDLVEQREHRSVERIFNESGQAFFRRAESEATAHRQLPHPASRLLNHHRHRIHDPHQ